MTKDDFPKPWGPNNIHPRTWEGHSPFVRHVVLDARPVCFGATEGHILLQPERLELKGGVVTTSEAKSRSHRDG